MLSSMDLHVEYFPCGVETLDTQRSHIVTPTWRPPRSPIPVTVNMFDTRRRQEGPKETSVTRMATPKAYITLNVPHPCALLALLTRERPKMTTTTGIATLGADTCGRFAISEKHDLWSLLDPCTFKTGSLLRNMRANIMGTDRFEN